MTNPPKSDAQAANVTDLESYVQLLRALLPRMSGVAIFNAAGEVSWASDITVDGRLARLIRESMRAAAETPGATGPVSYTHLTLPTNREV